MDGSPPWESRCVLDKELINDRGFPKSSSSRKLSVGEISMAYCTRTDFSLESINRTSETLKANSPTNLQSPSTLPTKCHPPHQQVERLGQQALKEMPGLGRTTRGVCSVFNQKDIAGSVAGSSAIDDESLVSTTSVPSYVAPTESVKARSRFGPMSSDKKGSPSEGLICRICQEALIIPCLPCRDEEAFGFSSYQSW